MAANVDMYAWIKQNAIYDEPSHKVQPLEGDIKKMFPELIIKVQGTYVLVGYLSTQSVPHFFLEFFELGFYLVQAQVSGFFKRATAFGGYKCGLRNRNLDFNNFIAFCVVFLQFKVNLRS
jgi:hypothetical protein